VLVIPLLAGLVALALAGSFAMACHQHENAATPFNILWAKRVNSFKKCQANLRNSLWFASSAGADIFISIALLYSFFTLKRQFSATHFGLSRLAFRAVASGSVTAVHALLVLVGLLLWYISRASPIRVGPDLLQNHAEHFGTSGHRRKFGYRLRVRFVS
jgi:hypothetical protein